ncbi:hypothetical protein OG851_42265 (plasmid) [Streptomyces sp. NBC_00161]|uniref:hypothetical protein n=1 Tax=Streptomyces sp. NBC_00161 TaxID=2975671 RepID=UPI002F91A5EA
MTLSSADRLKLRSIADDIIGCAALREYRMVDMLMGEVARNWGEDGEEHVTFLMAQDIVENAAPSARNAYAKVTAGTALTPEDRKELEKRIHRQLAGCEDMEMLYALTEDFLNAVWRDEPSDRKRAVSAARAYGGASALRTILLAIAVNHAPEAQSGPTPPSA